MAADYQGRHRADESRADTSPPARDPRPGLVAEILARATRPGQVRVLADPDYGQPGRS